MLNIEVEPGLRIGRLRCPNDFRRGGESTCRIRCPAGFKPRVGGSGENDRCVHETNNAYSVITYPIPIGSDEELFESERTRFMEDLQALQTKIDEDTSADQALQTEMGHYNINAAEYASIRSQYSAYNNVESATNSIKDTIDALKPRRPPTAPNLKSDIELERRNILEIVSQKLVMIQVALVTLLVCIVEYIVLPNEYAHKVAFLTAAVGLGVGIFLMSKK
jgi:hypothetical protein